jgi:cytochrome bd-type quinol oxidase subunit 2
MKKNKYIVIYAVLGILFIICCYIWLTFSINSKYVQFSLNISASILSIILTLSIVDNLIKKSEEEKSKPLRSAMYEEIRFFFVTFINFWQDINIATSEKHSAIDIKQLFESKKFSEMFLRLNLDKSPNVTPQTNWWY